MKQKTIILLLFYVLVLPGCARYAGYINDVFHQAGDIGESVYDARQYIRSQGYYDYFSTVILYDALWLSPEVRNIHNKLYQVRTGYEKQKPRVLHRTEFYVLLGPQAENPLCSLSGEASQWSIVLRMNDHVYQPIICERIEPDPEYRYILGDHLTQFRDVYRVVFDVQPNECMELVLQSPEYRVTLQW